jgi:hypothetical protein
MADKNLTKGGIDGNEWCQGAGSHHACISVHAFLGSLDAHGNETPKSGRSTNHFPVDIHTLMNYRNPIHGQKTLTDATPASALNAKKAL